MNERQSKLLVAIIDQFITTALPVGSQDILSASSFSVSGATIRNEMRFLGEEGYLMQPHISAGRIPTAKGYKAYVHNGLSPTGAESIVHDRFSFLREQYFKKKDQERAYDAVTLLSQMMPNVAFATVPHKERVFYLGLGNVLKQPEFLENPTLASGIAEVLEEGLSAFLQDIEIDEHVRYYIGEQDLLPELSSCSLMITRFPVRGGVGELGILGPMRMDYRYNTVALNLVASLLRDDA